MLDKTNTIKKDEVPLVVLAPEVEDQIDMFTHLVDTEIGGFGYVNTTYKGCIYVEEIFLVPQEVSGSEVDYEKSDGLQYAIERAVAEDRLDALRFVWHSHVNMAVFWSATDDKMVRDVGITADWLLNLVVNKQGERKARLDAFQSIPGVPRIQRTFDDLTVTRDLNMAVKDECEGLIEKFVTKRATKTYTTGSWKKDEKKSDGNVMDLTGFDSATPSPDATRNQERHEEIMAAREAGGTQELFRALALYDPGDVEQYVTISDQKVPVLDKMMSTLGWFMIADATAPDEVSLLIDQSGQLRGEVYMEDVWKELQDMDPNNYDVAAWGMTPLDGSTEIVAVMG